MHPKTAAVRLAERVGRDASALLLLLLQNGVTSAYRSIICVLMMISLNGHGSWRQLIVFGEEQLRRVSCSSPCHSVEAPTALSGTYCGHPEGGQQLPSWQW